MRIAPRNAYALIVAAAAFTLAAGGPPSDPDMWWHLASGRWMADHFSLLRVDVFSSTATGMPYSLGEWLGEVILYLAYVAGSWTGVIVLRAILVAVAAFAVTRLALRSAPPRIAVPLAALAILLSSPTWTDRPQLFTLALAPVLLDLLFAARASSRNAAIAIVPLLVVWSALHAGYVLGLGLVLLFAIAAAAERRSSWAPLAIAFVTATAVTNVVPGSLSLFRAFSHVAGATIGIVEESPVDALTPFGALFALFVGAVLLLFMLRGASLLAALVLAPLLLLALTAQRHIPLFGFAAAAFIARPLWEAVQARAATGDGASPAVAYATAAGSKRTTLKEVGDKARPSGGAGATAERRQDPRPLALAGLLWLGALTSMTIAPRQTDERPYPAGVEAALRSSSGVLLNEYDWGGWLIWNVPERPVFVDGRLYPYVADGIVEAYSDAVHLLPRWPSVISRWNVSQALLRKDRPLVEALRDEGWTVRAEGTSFVLLERPR